MNPTPQARIDAIDILRGLALALMLLVNNPGSWSAVYAPFLHADWHGLTPTDLVFPFFLFVVGASMACSLKRQIQLGGLPWLAVLKRSFLLFAIGFVLQLVPFDQAPDSWRIMGVLQRIGLCFMLVAILIAIVKERWLLLSAALVLIVYWLVLLSVGEAPYTVENNLVRYVDIAILGAGHMWQGKGMPFDPEGLLSTVGASVTVLSGYLVCANILQHKSVQSQMLQLAIVGGVLLGIGLLWSLWHPINKGLWTGSFVLVSSAAACFCLGLIILFWQVLNVKIGLNALKIYGSNPILIYVLAWLFAVFLGRVTVTIGENVVSLQQFVYAHFQLIMPDKLASLVYAISFTVLFYFLAKLLYNKRIFVKL
jgi:predicted acyltransferase